MSSNPTCEKLSSEQMKHISHVHDLRRRVAIYAMALAAAAAPATAFAHGGNPGQPGLSTLLTGWQFDPLLMIALAATTWVYYEGVKRVNRLHPRSPWPKTKSFYFYAGIGALVLGLLSPIARYDTSLFSMHMIQHLLIVMVGVPLMLLGNPVTLALRAASPEVRKKKLIPLLHSRPLRIITFPLLGWVFFALTMWATHFTGVFNHSLEHEWSHRLEHLWYMTAAFLFWWPVVNDIGPWRMNHALRALYLFVAMPQNSFVGNAIYSSGTVLYSHYVTLGRTWGPSPLADQEMAGVIMWVFGDLLFLGAVGLVGYSWMKHEEKATRRTDRQVAKDRAAARAAAEAEAAQST